MRQGEIVNANEEVVVNREVDSLKNACVEHRFAQTVADVKTALIGEFGERNIGLVMIEGRVSVASRRVTRSRRLFEEVHPGKWKPFVGRALGRSDLDVSLLKIATQFGDEAPSVVALLAFGPGFVDFIPRSLSVSRSGSDSIATVHGVRSWSPFRGDLIPIKIEVAVRNSEFHSVAIESSFSSNREFAGAPRRRFASSSLAVDQTIVDSPWQWSPEKQFGGVLPPDEGALEWKHVSTEVLATFEEGELVLVTRTDGKDEERIFAIWHVDGVFAPLFDAERGVRLFSGLGVSSTDAWQSLLVAAIPTLSGSSIARKELGESAGSVNGADGLSVTVPRLWEKSDGTLSLELAEETGRFRLSFARAEIE